MTAPRLRAGLLRGVAFAAGLAVGAPGLAAAQQPIDSAYTAEIKRLTDEGLLDVVPEDR